MKKIKRKRKDLISLIRTKEESLLKELQANGVVL